MMKKLLIFISAIMLAVAFVMPAAAVDWDFYASVRMQTFNVNQDENNPYNATVFDDRDSRWALNTVSRIGATVQNGDVGGRFEYGHSSSDVTLRRLYGTWNFGPGELLVGKDYTPIHFVTGQVYDNDSGLRRFGGFFTFQPMIQVKVDGFKLALISPNNGDPANLDDTTYSDWSINSAGVNTPDTDLTDDRHDYDNTYPKVEISYTLAMDTSSVRLFGGWNAFEVVGTNDREHDVTCYVYGVAGVVNVGPVTLKAMVWEGQNVGLYGLTTNPEADSIPDYDATVGTIRDNNGYGGIASIGVKINDTIGVEAGYGYVSFEDDPVGKNDNDEAWAAYLQAPITLAQGVTVVPEIGHYDYETNGTVGNDADQGYETYFGAKWQISF